MLTPLEVFRLRSELALEDLEQVQRRVVDLRCQLDALDAQRDRIWSAYGLALEEEQRLLLHWLKAHRQYTYYPALDRRARLRPFVLLLPMCTR